MLPNHRHDKACYVLKQQYAWVLKSIWLCALHLTNNAPRWAAIGQGHNPCHV